MSRKKKVEINEKQEQINEVKELREDKEMEDPIFESIQTTQKFLDYEFVRMLRDKEGYQELVKYMGMFPYYNIKNCILIKHQLPEASNVSRMAQWNFKGRGIIEGQKGLRVLVPIMEETYKTSEDGTIQKTGYQKIVGYKYGFVFDVSQTTGKELENRELTEERAEKIYPLFKERIIKKVIPLFRVHEVSDIQYAETQYNHLDIFINKDLSYVEKIKALVSQTSVCLAKYKANRRRGLYEDRIIGVSVYEAQAIAYATAYAMGIPYTSVQVPCFNGMRDELANEFEGNFSRMKSNMNKILDEYKGVYYELFQKQEKSNEKQESMFNLMEGTEKEQEKEIKRRENEIKEIDRTSKEEEQEREQDNGREEGGK